MNADPAPDPGFDDAPDHETGSQSAVPDALHALDPTTALVADLDALTTAPHDHGRVAPLHRDADLWLPLVGTLGQIARLTPRQRPRYLRSARTLWTAAAERWNSTRYADIGERVARWHASGPTLAVVRDLLWTFEQLESIGGVRTAYAALTALGALVPHNSRRAGYILAQSGRPLRTLGALDAALGRYDAGLQLGYLHHDPWLRGRSTLGAGGVHTFRGNHPAARQAFAYVLRLMPAHSVLAKAAHHGLVLCTTAAGDYGGAIRHGWESFRTRRADATARAEALSLLADLCTRVGRHESAIRAAEGALALTTLVRLRISLLRIALLAARAGGDDARTRRYATQLTRAIGAGGDLHEDAAGWLALAEVHAGWRDLAAAHQCLTAADALANRCGYHQLSFRIDEARAALHSHTLGEPRRSWDATPLDAQANAVLHALAHLPTNAAELLAL